MSPLTGVNVKPACMHSNDFVCYAKLTNASRTFRNGRTDLFTKIQFGFTINRPIGPVGVDLSLVPSFDAVLLLSSPTSNSYCNISTALNIFSAADMPLRNYSLTATHRLTFTSVYQDVLNHVRYEAPYRQTEEMTMWTTWRPSDRRRDSHISPSTPLPLLKLFKNSIIISI